MDHKMHATKLARLRIHARTPVIERFIVRGYRRHARLHARLHAGRALCNLGVNLALREDGELMQHRQTTTPVEGRRDGRRSIARTLSGLSVGGRVNQDVSVHLAPVSQATLPPSLFHPPPHFAPRLVRPRTYTYARAPRDGPFTIDTIVAASWPSPLRRRSLVSSTDSICPPRGCLITGRRVDRGRARQKGRSVLGWQE